tara:strand:+ start:3757 stop:4308 length:552 start_codon:yes stop_codon:yes gene_type:complete
METLLDNKCIFNKVTQTLSKPYILSIDDMVQKELNYWLMKSEPDAYSIDDLEKEKYTIWDGIRNYQARNFMRKMNLNDEVFFYHSNCKPPGIVGMMKVIEKDIVDPTQFEKNSKYFDPKSNRTNPRWDCVRLQYLFKAKKIISLSELRLLFSEDELLVVKKGNRLSITPVAKDSAKLLIKKLN